MSSTNWVGWLWSTKDRDWMSVCADEDMRRCHQELLRRADERDVATKHTALTQGSKPTWIMRYN